jgi:tRNA A-37 threonylcarbamoyl transferase component Bud32
MKQKIIQQGAEAKILHQKNNIIKHRISKGYRHPDLDKKIIKRRSKSEAKLLNKAASLIPSPKAELNDFNKISMPYLQGKKLSENLEKLNWKTISKTIGEQIAALHDGDIIHRFWSWIHQQQDRRQSSRSTPNKTSLRSKTFLNLEICLANNNKKLQI